MEIQNSANLVNEQPDRKQISSAAIVTEMDIQKHKIESEKLDNSVLTYIQNSDQKDTAEISPENSVHASEELETIRNIELLLAEFEAWQPFINSSVDKDLAMLKELYMILLKQIIDLSQQHEVQNKLLHILEAHMLGNIEKITERYFHSVDGFFQQFGEKSDQINLLNSLFKTVTGRSLPTDKISLFLDKGQHISSKEQLNGRTAAHENQPKGILYAKYSSEKTEPYNRAFSNKELVGVDYWKNAYLNQDRRTGITDLFLEEIPKKDPLYQLHDLKNSEIFLETFLDEGILIKDTRISACNSQIKGFLAAVIWLKVHTFLQSSHLQTGLFSSISQAVDRMVHFYIGRVADQRHSACLKDFSNNYAKPTDGNESSVYDIYYQIRSLFQSEKNAGKALSSGLKHAYEQYIKYSADEGFFFDHPDSPKSDCRQGFLLLKKDWKHFIDKMPASFNNRKELDADFISPWGDYVSPLNPLYNPEAGNPLIIVAIMIAGFFIAVCLFS